ncbi:GAF domain protein [Pseudooceanicola batsensis HTCC2597]|uniref:GAF domain protein n=1 Tax=Pseudooceanicola batsensis (strain ATCC BAA-863 / DSM 15984 / KCTC 12145 / HTCC2597) TaxID=252305 RepID=A3TZ91_PSEBH|nr:HlyD family efflux transporter periplasmic adaptor subunit [Pseudooceanicola batsensis]EAQ02909.1 GAF domain protein [Pseudooceanicola batsensis HTCC2597]
MTAFSGSTGPIASEQNTIALDASLWSSFANARGDRAFLTSWLALILSKVPRAALGVILEPDPATGAFVPSAIAPDPRRDCTQFRSIAEKVLGSGRPATETTEDGAVLVAYPVRIEAAPVDRVVALELRQANKAQGQAALREIHWAGGWLSARAWQGFAADQTLGMHRAAVALDLLALTAEHQRPEPAAVAIINELQTVMKADQVSLGMIVRRRASPRIRLMAMSYSAWFKKRSALVERLETAMEEAYDQNGCVAVPALASTRRAIAVAHDDLVAASRTEHVLTAPLQDANGAVGAITVERRRADAPFTDEDIRLLESVASLAGPVLELKRRNRRWFGGRIIDTVGHALGVVLGPRRLSWKLLTVALLALAVAAATVRGPFRITADGVMRGAVLRAAVAPFNGFIETAPARAGDTVAAGDVLAELDDTDLRLEELRWRSELDRLEAQQRDALAQYDRPQVAFLEAQIAQGRAQLDLALQQLSRTTITSPIDGLVVTGDLSQKLGTPVQPGELLYEVAPLDAFRIDIYVDERDLRHVTGDQSGRIALSGRPDEGLPFEITRITPVAEARDGANTFRVEAELKDLPDWLRPGMEGVARIDAGEELIAWVWSRRLINWLRETAWTWQP